MIIFCNCADIFTLRYLPLLSLLLNYIQCYCLLLFFSRVHWIQPTQTHYRFIRFHLSIFTINPSSTLCASQFTCSAYLISLSPVAQWPKAPLAIGRHYRIESWNQIICTRTIHWLITQHFIFYSVLAGLLFRFEE